MMRFIFEGFAVRRCTVAAGAVAALAASTGRAGAEVQIEASQRSVQILGARAGEWLGRPLVCADLDDDGFDDLVVGTDQTSIPMGERSHVYVFRGAADFLERGVIDLAASGVSADATIQGEAASTALATSMATGDFNGDGIADIALADSTMTAVPGVGSPRTGAGVVYIVYGSSTFFATPLRDFGAGGWDVKLLGASAGDDIGASSIFTGQIAQGLAMGDLNGDGVDDIAIGAHLADPGGRSIAGAVHVVYGEAALASGTTFDLATQSDSVIRGSQSENELGTALAFGDLDGDGIDDLIAGQEYYSQTTFASEGAVHVFLGRSTFPALIDMFSTAPSFRVLGVATYDTVGARVAAADVTGDGIDDLLALASGWDPAGSTSIDQGAVYGFAGRATWPATIDLAVASPTFQVRGAQSTASIGNALAAGRFDSDGFDDFFATARDSSRGVHGAEGRTFAVKGASAPAATINLPSGASHSINGGGTIAQLGDEGTTGDLNGDGFDEIVLSVPFVNSNTGTVAIFGTPLPLTSAAGGGWWMLE